MLYVNVINNQSYTAYQALNHSFNNYILPIRFPTISLKDLNDLSFCDVVLYVLKRFFVVNITSKQIEEIMKEYPIQPDALDRKTFIMRKQSDEIVKKIYDIISDGRSVSVCASICIKIALLFGIYKEIEKCGIQKFHYAISLERNDDLFAVLCAYNMGLPISKIICGHTMEDFLWNIIRLNDFDSVDESSAVIMYILCGKIYQYITRDDFETVKSKLNHLIYSSFISQRRVEETEGNIGKTYYKKLDKYAATAYCALQDYRALTGDHQVTLIFSAAI